MVAVTSLSMLVLGLPFTCHGGIHMFNVFNESVSLLLSLLTLIKIGSEFMMMEVNQEIEIPSSFYENNFRHLPGTSYFLHCWRSSWCLGFMESIGISYPLVQNVSLERSLC